MRLKLNNILLLVICIFAVSCSGTRHLPEGEKLYVGSKVKLESVEKISGKKSIVNAAESVIRPKPNKKILGMRPKLCVWYMAGDTIDKSRFRKWLKRNGEEPVFISNIKPGETAKFIDARLFNIGIFKNFTTYKVEEKSKTATVVYTCFVHPPFKIKQVNFPDDDTQLSELITSTKEKTLLKPGNDYNLDDIKRERERIDAVLKDSGYFFFNSDFLLFKADTSETDKTVTLSLIIKDETPYKSLLVYRINDVSVDPHYSLRSERDTVQKDTVSVDGVLFLRKDNPIRPTVILRSVFLKKNDIYSRRSHNITLNRLMSMGTFKFVNVKFTESDTSNPGFLDAKILLTPMPKRSFSSEFNMVSKSNNFIGPQANINYRNRNTFNGAELLNLTLAGSFETQFSGRYKNLYSYEINPQVELFIPKFVVPFKINNPSGYYVPKTRFAIGYSYLKRIDYFNLTSLSLSYGFKWKENVKTDHELTPVNINFTSIRNKSTQFDSLLNANPFLKKSYEEQFIVGSTYSFTFNEQVITEQISQFYLNVTAELAGNSLSLANRVFVGRKASAEDPYQVVGSIYSQFARIALDTRNYFNFRKKNKIAVRFYTGVGKAYGNSSTLPYIKQFFSGGPNSIRAFPINTLGPGTYQQNDSSGIAFLDQGGDIKIEANAEYRCNLVSILKGALFVDAGNIWLLKANPSVPSLPFSYSRFYKEIAVGTGVGLRVDASFFVLRFDLSIPLRKPWLNEGERWVIRDIKFGDADWRSDNMIFNIAIGYPF